MIMITKEQIENAIKLRIDRFNNLWIKALGYSFEEEVEIEQKKYEAQMKVWNDTLQPRLIKRANELGFKDDDEYFKYCWKNNIQPENRDSEIQSLWEKYPNNPSPLYNYEMLVINQAKSIVFWFIDNFTGHETEQWEKFVQEANKKGEGSFKFVKVIEESGYNDWDDGHSGNSGGMSVRFAYEMLHNLELFPYEHGALCLLVEDEGYHDDRSDVHEAIEHYKSIKKQKHK